jgi:hypothetical protein
LRKKNKKRAHNLKAAGAAKCVKNLKNKKSPRRLVDKAATTGNYSGRIRRGLGLLNCYKEKPPAFSLKPPLQEVTPAGIRRGQTYNIPQNARKIKRFGLMRSQNAPFYHNPAHVFRGKPRPADTIHLLISAKGVNFTYTLFIILLLKCSPGFVHTRT